MSRTNTYLRELPPGLTHIDVYWVLRLFNVTDPCAQHAVKKLLADGSGDKDRATNIREAWETLDRWCEMEGEATPKELRQNHPDGLTRWIEESRRQYESMDPWVKPKRQEQVRERYSYQDDVQPDSVMQDDQRPPDRHSTTHCPDGGACKHKCGLEPCKDASE